MMTIIFNTCRHENNIEGLNLIKQANYVNGRTDLVQLEDKDIADCVYTIFSYLTGVQQDPVMLQGKEEGELIPHYVEGDNTYNAKEYLGKILGQFSIFNRAKDEKGNVRQYDYHTRTLGLATWMQTEVNRLKGNTVTYNPQGATGVHALEEDLESIQDVDDETSEYNRRVTTLNNLNAFNNKMGLVDKLLFAMYENTFDGRYIHYNEAEHLKKVEAQKAEQKAKEDLIAKQAIMTMLRTNITIQETLLKTHKKGSPEYKVTEATIKELRKQYETA